MSTVKGAINIANGVEIGATITIIETVGAEVSRLKITQASVTNTGSGIVTISIYVLQDGDTLLDKNKVLANKTIGVNETYLLYELIGNSIDTGGTIQTIADIANDVSIFITGTEYR